VLISVNIMSVAIVCICVSELDDLQLEDEGDESEEESEAIVPLRDDSTLCVATHKGDTRS